MQRDTVRYGNVAQGLHWISALLIFIQVPMGLVMARLDGGWVQAALYRMHVGAGLMVLLLTAARIGWRLVQPSPETPPGLSRARTTVYHGVHVLLYVVLIGLTGTGFAILIGSGMTPLPLDVTPDAVSDDLPAIQAHVVLGWIYIGLLTAHIGGVMQYQLKKGDVMSRMGITLPMARGEAMNSVDRPS